MRAYIHAFQGRPWNEECRAAYDGFRELGIETVLFTTNEEFDTRNPEDVVVGGNVIVWHALNQNGIIPEHYDYPPELSRFIGRNIRKMKLKDIQNENLPVFIKSVEDKAAPGIVIKPGKILMNMNTWIRNLKYTAAKLFILFRNGDASCCTVSP